MPNVNHGRCRWAYSSFRRTATGQYVQVYAVSRDRRHLSSGKQRWTAPTIQEALLSEGLSASERTIRRCMAEWKRSHAEVFVPLVYRPGELAEVDFFEVVVGPPEARRKAHLFLMREMYGPQDFACLYDRQDQVCFLDGHVQAFEHFGGVPQRLVYDNLSSAVRKVLVGSERELTARFQALASHYVFEPCFARPGTGHDKGGVEARGKGIRLRHLTPIPKGTDLVEISRVLQARLDAQATAQAERIEESARAFLPLPQHPFRPERTLFLPVSGAAMVRLDNGHYSVPEGWARRQVEVRVGAREVTFVREDVHVVHRRLRGNEKSIQYTHYLEQLSRKTQALRQVAPELMRELGKPFDCLWNGLVEQHGPKDAARRFRTVLTTIRRDGLEPTRARLSWAIHEPQPLLALLGDVAAVPTRAVVPFPLQTIEVPTTSVALYDAILGVTP
ncbi:MAG: IS21 family transposase [Myxococcota bacterium]|nr:IS21 family transposase [Myxococcota bacterium]